MAPPATAAAAGVAVQAGSATGVTAFAPAVPLFFTARVAVNTWFVLTVVALGVSVAESAAAVWTVMDAVTVPVEAVAPLFASVPLADVLTPSVPAVDVEHPVYWKLTVAPPATAAEAGVPVHGVITAGVTALAVAVPLFFTAKVTVKVWPVETVPDAGVNVAVRAMAVWTVTVALAVPVDRVAPLFASVPVADALSESVPAEAEEQPVYWKLTVAPPATAAAAGVPVQLAIAAGVTAFAAATPVFFTARVAVNTWPVLTVVALVVNTADRAPCACTVTWVVAVGAETVAPVFASFPDADALRVSVWAVALEHPP
ncbi:MAG TPA: hypothetical protein VMT17_11150 [Anaeromyxobacteraceae bacterium]|nr:hypothetical protein [Anaeromyxobacteraceae bacterium]